MGPLRGHRLFRLLRRRRLFIFQFWYSRSRCLLPTDLLRLIDHTSVCVCAGVCHRDDLKRHSDGGFESDVTSDDLVSRSLGGRATHAGAQVASRGSVLVGSDPDAVAPEAPSARLCLLVMWFQQFCWFIDDAPLPVCERLETQRPTIGLRCLDPGPARPSPGSVSGIRPADASALLSLQNPDGRPPHTCPGVFSPAESGRDRDPPPSRAVTSPPHTEASELSPYDGGRVRAWLGVQSPSSCSKAVQTEVCVCVCVR